MGFISYIKGKQLHAWGLDYARHKWTRERESASVTGTRHLLFAVCDHWEPLFAGAADHQGDRRVERWVGGYPELAKNFRDADGVHPQHSFFFPGEHYRPRWMDRLAELAKSGFGEVELHLHHDGDTRESLGADLRRYVSEIASHGHFARAKDGSPRYAFIHGNWCLANARPDGRYCGVDDEIPLLYETGCYADFTFPAPDDPSQPKMVNQIFWPSGDLSRRRGYEGGERAKVGSTYHDRMLFLTGPSALYLAGKKPKIEASNLTANAPGTAERVKLWGDLGICVEGRPEWVFAKMHTHGCPEKQADSLLGADGARMHQALAEQYNDGVRWKLHYVSAREMYNIARAAMDGRTGDPNEFRDYELPKPPVRR